MIKLFSESTVECACTLSPKDEQKVFDFMKVTEMELEDAVKELWLRGEINIYWNSTKSDWNTNYIYDIESISEEEE